MSTPRITYPSTIKQYKLSDELGQGAFSTVCRAINTENQEIYACKIFPKTNLEGTGDQERFQREVNAMAYLKHDNLVTMYDFFWDERNFYMIIDYCPGGELFDYIVKNDKLQEPTAALIFQQIASAVAYCHSYGVAHRDLKPENVLINRFPSIKVSDFGLCGYIADEKLMKTFCGSPCYCAPECLSRVQYDGRMSDVWSLGVILFAMVTGEHPWNITNTTVMLRQILRGAYTVPAYVSPQCKELLSSMMKVDPHKRITMVEVLKHPWLKCASRAKVTQTANLIVTAPSLPPLQSVKLMSIAEEAARSSSQNEVGIISPFVEDINTPTLPRLCVRSASLENVKVANGITLGSARRKMQPTGGLSLAANRQRSVTNLVGIPATNNRSKTPMMTITEAD